MTILETAATQQIEISTLDVKQRIYTLRGINVMFDVDLAEIYEVKTKVLKQSVKRNIERFPEDFMFETTREEVENLRSQFVTSSVENSFEVTNCDLKFRSKPEGPWRSTLRSIRFY